MAPKVKLVLAVICFVLINSGETFTGPRPRFVEIDKNWRTGFLEGLKAMFGLQKEKNENYEQLEPLRKKMKCARLAKDLNKPWIEEYCLNALPGLPNKKPFVYGAYRNWNFGF